MMISLSISSDFGISESDDITELGRLGETDLSLSEMPVARVHGYMGLD
jgi:hypothetical protein